MKHNEVVPVWRKSSRCGSSACVEVAEIGDMQVVRDSKDLEGPVVAFGATAWRTFIAEIGRDGFSAS